jgi:hypothetical protein
MLQGKSTDLHHLIYASSATQRLNQNELLELLKNARRNNEVNGLTGMLLYRDGLYLQFFEGQRNDVSNLLNRLRNDPRHKSIRILREGTLPERLFPEWSMAYRNLIGLRSSLVPGYSERLQGSYVGESDKDPAELLTRMFHELLVTG